MKIVQGKDREYQLVARTKRKDFDGTIYLAAGEKNIWVKLLSDCSPDREQAVKEQIVTGFGSFLDTPVDLVRENGKFVGYAFVGQEMEVVPVQQPSAQKQKGKEMRPQITPSPSKTEKQDHIQSLAQNPATGMSTVQKFLLLAAECFILTAFNCFAVNSLFAKLAAEWFGFDISRGFVTFGLHGIMTSLFGIVAVIFLSRRRRAASGVTATLLAGLAAYAIVVLLASILLVALVLLLTLVVGTVQQYMGVIIVIVVLVIVVKSLF